MPATEPPTDANFERRVQREMDRMRAERSGQVPAHVVQAALRVRAGLMEGAELEHDEEFCAAVNKITDYLLERSGARD